VSDGQAPPVPFEPLLELLRQRGLPSGPHEALKIARLESRSDNPRFSSRKIDKAVEN